MPSDAKDVSDHDSGSVALNDDGIIHEGSITSDGKSLNKWDMAHHVSNSSLSNLTISDPDIASSSSGVGSSSGSSRPPSSSGLVSPDLALPAPEDYTPEPVDFDPNAQQLKLNASVRFTEGNTDDDVTPPFSEPPSHTSSEFNSPEINGPPSITIRREYGSEAGSDVEEEYFEEYHLPNTHENAFVRHQSFRRKVQLTPINAPDAKKIEDIVRTGELHRHGSIRRRITSDHDLPKLDPNYSFRENDELEENEFEKDIKEIESMLKDEESPGQIIIEEKTKSNDDSPLQNQQLHLLNKYGTTSTPKSTTNQSAFVTYDVGDLSVSLDDASGAGQDHAMNSDNSLSIEQTTLLKIQDCLDVMSYKDMYNLSGRLQDILTPLEVEEILNNSERYTEYINEEIIEALTNSLNEQNMDSGVSSSKFSSLNEKPKENNQFKEAEDGKLVEHRRSIRISREEEAEGIFIESNSQNPNMKKIKATSLDFDSSCNDDDILDDDDTSQSIDEDLTKRRVVRSASQYEESDVLVHCSSIVDQNERFIDSCPSLEASSRPSNFATPLKRIAVSEDILRSPDDDALSVSSEISHHSDMYEEENEDDANPPTEITKEPSPTVEFDRIPTPPPFIIPELSAAEETNEERHWRTIVLGGVWRRIDMKVIAPYRKCVSHGGYVGQSTTAVIVVSACHLPDKGRRDYNYVMDNLFLYVLSTLEQLITDDYILVYFASGGSSGSGPGFQWLKKAYQMIDRKLRKNLKSLEVVHPTLWVRTVVAFSRPFISSKFYRKMSFINNLAELSEIVPIDQLEIPDVVRQSDFELMIKEKKKYPNRRVSEPVLPSR